ncbi:hypothetical protein [Spiroplasma cantharicola]|uniref:Transmembrane protein n=1 Tax=Spiroplasma cantharicola TaxID=362837 RepID=A0A0M4KD93_9MOLU|nr:hypothetical protein [Spiroplasma cantharicola]ALD66877.1 hypothetical protein SCANT_v1c09710 [Spiroplasma cantharicola]
MFAIFIIFAWSLTLVASVALIAFAAFAIIMLITSPNPPEIIKNVLKIFTEPLFESIFGSGGKANFSNVGKPEFNEIPVIIWISISIAFAILLMTLSITEFVRLRKHQRLSKPFVKIVLLTICIIVLLTGQLIFFIVSMIILATLILLEIVLFDSVALNNYAEERNLISIYREEKKFEKEVTKEGKLIGNVELRNQKKDSQKENDQNKRNDNSALPILNETQLDNFFRNEKNKKYYFKWKEYKTKLEIKRLEIQNTFYSLEENKKAEVVSKFNFNVMRLNKLGRKLKIPNDFQVLHLDLNKLVEDNYPQTAMIFKENIVEKNQNNLNESVLDKNFVEEQKAKAVNMSFEELKEIESPISTTSDSIYNDFNFEESKISEQAILNEVKNIDNKELIDNNNSDFDTFNNSKEIKKQEDLDMIDLPKLEFSEFNQNFDGDQREKAVNMSIEELIEINLPSKTSTELDFNKINSEEMKAINDENKEEITLKSNILGDASFTEKLARAVNVDINQLSDSENMNTNIDLIYSDFNFKPSDINMEVIENNENHSNNLDSSSKTYVTLPPKMTLEFINEEKEQEQKEMDNLEDLKVEKSEIKNDILLNEDEFKKETVIETYEEIAPKVENNYNDKLVLIKDKSKQNDDLELLKNYSHKDQIEEIKRQLIIEQQNLAESCNSKMIEFEKQKISSIEKRIIRLENLLESLDNRIVKDTMIHDFTNMTYQLESISKVVNELKNHSPRNVLNSLTTRYESNKNNG